MAKRGNGGMTKWLWMGAAAVVGYVVLDKLGIIDQIRSQIGTVGVVPPAVVESKLARVNYSYSAADDHRWLSTQYPESMQARAYIGDAYGQGSQSMSGEYNSIPYALS